jgi:hypothetical protein
MELFEPFCNYSSSKGALAIINCFGKKKMLNIFQQVQVKVPSLHNI